MDIEEFNNKFEGFRFVETDVSLHLSYPLTLSRENHKSFSLEEYCPNADKWCRMIIPGVRKFFQIEEEKPIEFKDSFIESFIKTIKEDRVFIAYEKHITRYFRAKTSEDIGLVSLLLLKQRFEDGYYNPHDNKLKEPSRSLEDFENDPELADFISNRWEKYHQAEIESTRSKKMYELIKNTLESKDYSNAYWILENRKEYAYENIQIETLESVCE